MQLARLAKLSADFIPRRPIQSPFDAVPEHPKGWIRKTLLIGHITQLVSAAMASIEGAPEYKGHSTIPLCGRTTKGILVGIRHLTTDRFTESEIREMLPVMAVAQLIQVWIEPLPKHRYQHVWMPMGGRSEHPRWASLWSIEENNTNATEVEQIAWLKK